MFKIISDIIKNFGIDVFGVCSFLEIKPYLIECRAKSRIPEKAQSIITMLFPYYISVKNHNISRYAIVQDYHKICGDILREIAQNLRSNFSNFKFVPFIDNSPIPEVRCGVLCGLGVLGDNNLLINEKYGSWVFIGEIVTDMPLKGTTYNKKCLKCGKCKNACPGKCLDKNEFQISNCLSHLTQKKGSLTTDETSLIKKGNSLWGCDICQEICPMNSNVFETNLNIFKENIHPNITLNNYKNLENRAFQWRPKTVLERNFEIFD